MELLAVAAALQNKLALVCLDIMALGALDYSFKRVI